MNDLRRRFNSPSKVGIPSLAVPVGGNSNSGNSVTAVTPEDAELEPLETPVGVDGSGGGWKCEPLATAESSSGGSLTWGPENVRDAEAHIIEHLHGVDTFCGTGAAAVGRLAALLAGTRYGHVSEQCRLRLEDVQRVTKAEVAQVATEVKVTLGKVSPIADETVSEEDVKLVATAFTRLMQLHCQFLLTASDVLAPLSKYVNEGQLSASAATTISADEASQSESAAGQLSQSNSSSSHENPSQSAPASHSVSDSQGNVNEQDSSPKSPPAENNKSNHMVHAVGSPSGLRKISSFFSKLTRSGSGPLSGDGNGSPQSSFYVSIPKEDLSSTAVCAQDNNENQNDARGQSDCEVVGGAGLTPSARPAEDDSVDPAHDQLLLTTTNMNNLKLPQGATDISQVLPGLPPNGRLATQEELDSVIDLLSGGQRSPMQVIPENVPSHHVTANKPPPLLPLPQQPPAPIGPQHYGVGSGVGVMPHHHLQHPLFIGLPPPDGPPPPLPPSAISGDNGGLYARNHQNHHHQHNHHNQNHNHHHNQQQHRRSDGMLGENFPRDQKTNTWPYRPHVRSAAGELGPGLVGVGHHAFPSGSGIGGGCYDGPADVDYTRYLAAVKAMKVGSGGGPAVGSGSGIGASLGGQGPWSSGDAALHRSWPMHLFNHDAAENVARNWSTVGDSSSCSDESSTGDGPWMMGLDLMGAVSDKRRHSSGEESFPGAPPCSHVAEMRPRSVENLLESKSTNTWPPKQPWAKPGRRESDGLLEGSIGHTPPHHPSHPPLTMQWSDPLTNRPLSAWDGGRHDTQLL